ncbi:STAS domain-containing protein [bacterium]|nr:STAS domain-containing protein [FCB group bacterium]MBL7191792.1 STAS domain-containing protein [bacterium]
MPRISSIDSRRSIVNQKIPILKIKDYLIVPIQVDMDDRLALQLQMDILKQIEKCNSRGVIIDISVIDMVDSYLGRILGDTARMAGLMDARVVIAGMQPAVAITLVELGLGLEGVYTALNLEAAISLLEELLDKDAA